MSKTSLETLFGRYASKGDVRALGQVFDRAAPELLVIAGHLARDPVEAEDLVQQAFVGAIESAARYDPSRPLMPWLVGILTRGARYRARQAARRPEPDRLGWRPAPPDPARASEREELVSALAAALERVPPTYREVLRRHLTDGEAPREIAQAMGRAPGTVRVQLHRGLDQLRKALPPSFALGAAASAWPTRGLAAVRAEVLAVGTGARVVTAGAWITGRVGATLGASLFLAVAWFGVSAMASRPSPTTRAEPEQVADTETSLEGGAALAGAGDLPARVNLLAADSADRSALKNSRGRADSTRGQVEAESNLAKGEDWFLRGQVQALDFIDWTQTTISATRGEKVLGSGSPDINGKFDLQLGPQTGNSGSLLGDLVVRADHPDFAVTLLWLPRRTSPGFVPATEERPQQRVLRVNPRLAPPHAVIEGGLTFSGGAARVALFALDGNGDPEASAIDEADLRGGSFRLRVPRRGKYLLVGLAPGWLPASRVIELEGPAGQHVQLDPLFLERGRELRVHVRLPAGLSAQDCTVELIPAVLRQSWSGTDTIATILSRTKTSLDWSSLAWCESGLVRLQHEARVDQLGGCLIAGVPSIKMLAGVREVPGLDDKDAVGLTRVEPRDLDVELVPPVALQRFVVTDGGGPVTDARVEVSMGCGPLRSLAVDETGLASILMPSDAQFFCQVTTPRHEPRSGQRRPAGSGGTSTFRVKLKLAAGGLGEAALRPGGVRDEVALIWNREGSDEVFHATLPVKDGIARLTGLPQGRIEVSAPLDAPFLFESVILVTGDEPTPPVDLVGQETGVGADYEWMLLLRSPAGETVFLGNMDAVRNGSLFKGKRIPAGSYQLLLRTEAGESVIDPALRIDAKGNPTEPLFGG